MCVYFIEGIRYNTNFFIPLGNHVPSGNGQFPKPGLYLSRCPPTKTQKFNTYFSKLAKATKTQDGEKVKDKDVQVLKPVLERLPAKWFLSGLLTCTLASGTSINLASSWLRGEKSIFGVGGELKYSIFPSSF